MRILLSLTYYLPHISGVTVYNHRLAKALAAEGHHVTVLTSRFRRDLPREEIVDGVRVVRLPVWFRISKGAILPGFPLAFPRLVRAHDVVVMNIPNTPVEAFSAPVIARLKGKPLLVIHMCDVQLPPGFLNRMVSGVVFLASLFAAAFSDRLVTMTDDYARHSPVLSRFLRKVVAVPPPMDLPPVAAEETAAWRRERGGGGTPMVGFAARFSTEKGVEVMLKALPELRRRFPEIRVLFAGEYEKVFGEKRYRERLMPLLESNQGHWSFLGVVSQEEIPHFYSACEVTVLPSMNRTESFGLVQAESMLCGTPVVASDLPGVRQAVLKTGMGKIVPVGDADALAAAIAEVIHKRPDYVRSREEIERVFSTRQTRQVYESVFDDIVESREIAWTHLREKPWFLALQRSVEHRLLARAGPFERPILDVGSGDGHFGPAALGCSIDVGLDLDPRTMAQAGRRRFQGQPAYTRLVLGSAARMPLPDASVSTIVSNSTMEHIPELDAVLREMFRVLKPGGRLLLTVPTDRWETNLFLPRFMHRMGLKGLARRYKGWFRRKQRHHHLLSPEEWAGRVETAGFRIVRRRQYFSSTATGWLEVLHYAGWPNLITKAITGRWVLLRWRPLFCLSEWLVARFVTEPERATDSCVYLEARKPAREDQAGAEP